MEIPTDRQRAWDNWEAGMATQRAAEEREVRIEAYRERASFAVAEAIQRGVDMHGVEQPTPVPKTGRPPATIEGALNRVIGSTVSKTAVVQPEEVRDDHWEVFVAEIDQWPSYTAEKKRRSSNYTPHGGRKGTGVMTVAGPDTYDGPEA